MDRQLVYPGQIPLETDLLNTNRNAMTAIAKLAAAMFGTGTFINGLAVTQNSTPALNVLVSPGEIYSLMQLDASAYSSLAADTVDYILKQGITLATAMLSCPAPGAAGQSINYLVQAVFAETDTNLTLLPYYNSSNPSVAWSGPANAGTTQATTRADQCVVTIKAGAAAATGSQTTPAPDANNIGIAVITVANGQASVLNANIAQYSGAALIPAGGAMRAVNSAMLTKSVAGSSNITLDQNGEATYPIINLTGALTGNINVIVPVLTDQWIFANNTTGPYTITVKTAAGTGYVIPQGGPTTLYCDGTNVDLTNETGATAPAGDSSVKLATTAFVSNTLDPNLFYKLDAFSPAFLKTAAGTISIKAGSSAMVFGVKLVWAANTAVTMPALTGGTDYAIYGCADGTIRADSSFSAPTGYSTANSRMIGGFHYGLVAPATTVAGGSFATAGNGMIWVQGNVDDIAGINKFSIWDLKFRPAASNPAGMVLVNGRTWVDIYLCSTDTAANGTSKYNTNIASGTVLPKIPAQFGGNGTTTYPTLNWWVANELARANQKRLMRESEFVDAAFGVTENQSIDATASTYPTTLRNAGYTSKYGIEQASGHHWTWGEDSNFSSEVASPGWTWKDVNGNNAAGTGRGQDFTAGTYGLSRVQLGGSRANGANSGSRASYWNSYPWGSGWNLGLRAACDHMISV